jgi:hypothetical protein
MRLYRGLKNPYRPSASTRLDGRAGTDFTDCPAVALRYAQGSRAAVLVVDIDPGEHLASAKLTQEFWFVRDAKRFMLWGRFDQFITAIIPAKDLRTQVRLRGLRNALDDAKAPLLRAFIDRELRDRQLRRNSLRDPTSPLGSLPTSKAGSILTSVEVRHGISASARSPDRDRRS